MNVNQAGAMRKGISQFTSLTTYGLQANTEVGNLLPYTSSRVFSLAPGTHSAVSVDLSQ